MATDPVLQWQSHVTDSTDKEAILNNLDVLEKFAGAIKGDNSLDGEFETIRKGIKDGSIKPTKWQSSEPFVQITSKLKEASSGKIATLTKQGEDLKENLGKKLDSKDFSDFKTGDFKTTTESIGTRLDTAEGSITSYGTRLDTAEGSIKNYGPRITSAEGSIKSHGTRIGDAETALGNKLDSSTFNNFKTTEFKTALGKKLDSSNFESFKSALEVKIPTFASSAELENLKTLLNNEVSHWTAEATPLPQSYTVTAQVKASTQPWGKDEDPERHIGDLCTVIGEKATDKGVSYRFVKHPTADTYKWLKVIDNDGALALGNLKTFEEKYNQRQEVINNALANKQPKGNYVEKTDFDANNTKVDREIKELKGTYKVTVTTQGEIRNGEIVGGTMHDSKPAILHTAHVYGILGNKITDPKIINKLTWTVNKGRTTLPEQRFVTGATCYVTADDFVRVLHTQGSNPQFYDIELNSSF